MNNVCVEINLDTLKNNTKEILKKYNEYKYYIGVLKSNAYGHGEYIVNELIDSGINYIAVSYLDEAINIRKYNKDIPILCFTNIDIEDIDIAIKNNVTLTITSENYLDKLIKILNKKIKVHIKLDTGMNRLGIKEKKEIDNIYKKIKNNKYIELEGIYTHLSTIGLNTKSYDNQIEKFKYLTKNINLNEIPIVHITSSANLVAHDKIDFTNGVRLGSIIYGYNPSIKVDKTKLINKLKYIKNKYIQKKLKLSKIYTNVNLNIKPAIKMYTKILEIKKVKKDENIGYGLSYKANKDLKIAIIPVGYNNGIGFSINKQLVMINNKIYKSAGQISMNMMAIIIDDTVKLNDKVEIINETLTTKYIASFSNRLPIEILLSVGRLNAKVYIKDGKEIYKK
jgi:alanine racemase